MPNASAAQATQNAVSPENLALAFYDFPYEPYAPVRRQLLVLLREVNAVRRQAGYQVLPIDVLPLRRRIVKPFGEMPSGTLRSPLLAM